MPPKSKRLLPGKRYPLNMRTTKELRDKIEWAATVSGRSLVQEVEFRLERLFQQEEIEKLTDTVTLQVRLPERLRRRLEQAAEHNKWSMNTEIFDRLDVSFQRDDRKEMEEKAARDAVQALQEFQEEMIERAAKKAARDAVQAQREIRNPLATELSKSKHESPPNGED
jgi:predicted HicB family RNase H-like nuclease